MPVTAADITLQEALSEIDAFISETHKRDPLQTAIMTGDAFIYQKRAAFALSEIKNHLIEQGDIKNATNQRHIENRSERQRQLGY